MTVDIPAIWDATVNAGGPMLKNAGSVVAALAISKTVLEAWRKSFGRRRRWIKLYGQLSLGLQIKHAFELFGTAAYKNTFSDEAQEEFTEYVWPLAGDGYVQILVGKDESIRRYSLTACSKRFKPRFFLGFVGSSSAFPVKLGKTTFSGLPDQPSEIYLTRGASFYEYGENRSFGRPGKYMDWICSHSMMGIGRLTAIPINIPADDEAQKLHLDWEATLSEEQKRIVHDARRQTAINTITVSDLTRARLNGHGFGPRMEAVERRPQRQSFWDALLRKLQFWRALGKTSID
ncbi:hypothetical protein LWP59_34575 [Amycolatopsis acidiphila]|uniref:Uncharacterized protein n=1 Tax=Amycolatopsis acidiphila TaxID=715473 RepID=A0A558A0K7_9PSEU|nr:ETEC_3214 domain-containing protein [Amycolatopsis acidiphila]TVT17784.1 hypothetical protein FNH06_30030 [Amycolatopsis acidiphila]UIJ59130.1 hypothetical protein LWP59_34575 [Amycolatopsis acidiphila]